MSIQITPARRAQLSLAGKVGGNTAIARHGTAFAAKGRQTFRDSFINGHGCAVCPLVVLPDDLTPRERETRSDALYKAHYARMRHQRGRA